MSFIPKPKTKYRDWEELNRSHAVVVNQFTGQKHHFPGTPFWEERKIADSLTRFFSEHPLRSGGMMHLASVGLLEELGYVMRKEEPGIPFDPGEDDRIEGRSFYCFSSPVPIQIPIPQSLIPFLPFLFAPVPICLVALHPNPRSLIPSPLVPSCPSAFVPYCLASQSPIHPPLRPLCPVDTLPSCLVPVFPAPNP